MAGLAGAAFGDFGARLLVAGAILGDVGAYLTFGDVGLLLFLAEAICGVGMSVFDVGLCGRLSMW